MSELCSDCPPVGCSTEKTRCRTCPRSYNAGPSEDESDGVDFMTILNEPNGDKRRALIKKAQALAVMNRERNRKD